MPAMTMAFRLSGPTDAVAGDFVAGTLVTTKDTEWIENLTIARKGPNPSPRMESSGMPTPGSVVPDFEFRNQDDKRVHLEQFRGLAVLLTFVYTRCPFPDYCPRLMRNFNAVNRGLAADPAIAGRVRLLSISIDPEYDTPEVLRRFGERSISGADRFVRWDLLTGSPESVRKAASWFGLIYGKESGQIVHSLVTALIGPDGRLRQIYSDGSWTPAQALRDLKQNAREDAVGR